MDADAMATELASIFPAGILFELKQGNLTVWKNTAASEDGYVTGIEPATGYPFNRKVERKFGRVPKLAPGESRSFTLDYGIHTGSEAVEVIYEKVNAIQGETPIKVNENPPKKD